MARLRNLAVGAALIVGLVGIAASPASAASTVSGSGCTVRALVTQTKYSSGISVAERAVGSFSCASTVSISMKLVHDNRFPAPDAVFNTAARSYLAPGGMVYGAWVNCGTYSTPRGGQYRSELTMKWSGHTLTAKGDTIRGC